MSGYETTYSVKVRYSVDGNAAGQATSGLREQTKALATEARGAGDELKKVGALVVGVFAGHEARKALITFNAGVENAKIGLSSMIQGNRGGTWERATEQAGRLYDEFQAFSQLTPVTTSEILDFGKSVAVSTFQAGGAIKDLTSITEQGVVAAKAFGYGSAYAALELSEMLAGNVNKRMMFAKQLLGIAHVEEQQFNALSAEKRLGIVEKVLNSDAMKNAAKAFGESWSGVTSTLEDKLQITLGKVGLPLFKAITSEVKNWNTWLDANKSTVETIGHTIGEGLVKGFSFVKDVVTFLVAHADTLMTIGKIWLATKVGGLIEGAVGGAGGVAGAAGRLFGTGGFFRRGKAASDAIDPFTGEYSYTPAVAPGRGFSAVTMSNLAGNLPLIGQSLALGMAFGQLLKDSTGLGEALHNLAIGETGRELERVRRASDALTTSLDRAADAAPGHARAETNLTGSIENYRILANLAGDAARAANQSGEGGDENAMTWKAKLDALEKMGVGQAELNQAGGLQAYAEAQQTRANQLQAQKDALIATGADAWEMGLMTLTDYQRQTLDSAKAQQDLLAYINNSLARGIPISPKTITELLRADTDDPEGKHKKLAERPNVNVHINRIEVQSDDPDRLAFGLIESFRQAAKNPSAAFATFREG